MVADPNALIASVITAVHCDSIPLEVVIRCSFNEPSWSANCTEHSVTAMSHSCLIASSSCCADPPDGLSLPLTLT